MCTANNDTAIHITEIFDRFLWELGEALRLPVKSEFQNILKINFAHT